MNSNLTRTILLVEDDPNDEALTLRALGKHHIANGVTVVRDGAEALEWLNLTGRHTGRDAKLLPAVVLLDIKLPKVDGLEVLRRIRQDPRTKTQPVVILTSSKEESDVARSYALGVNAYVRKPVEFESFLKAVSELGLFWLLINEPPPYRLEDKAVS